VALEAAEQWPSRRRLTVASSSAGIHCLGVKVFVVNATRGTQSSASTQDRRERENEDRAERRREGSQRSNHEQNNQASPIATSAQYKKPLVGNTSARPPTVGKNMAGGPGSDLVRHHTILSYLDPDDANFFLGAASSRLYYVCTRLGLETMLVYQKKEECRLLQKDTHMNNN